MKQTNGLIESIIYKIVRQIVNETVTKPQKEQMLIDLFNYLSKEPTDDIYDGGKYGKHY